MNLFRIVIPLLLAALSMAAPRQAPDFALPTPDGRTIRLSEQRNKIVVLEFLQTACPHCQETGRTLQKLYEAKAARGLQVIGISHDAKGMPAIRGYIEQFKLTYPVVLGDLDVAVNYIGLTPAKPSFSVPVFFFIDRQGRVVEERLWDNRNDREWFAKLPGSLEATVQRLLGPAAKTRPASRRSARPRSRVPTPK